MQNRTPGAAVPLPFIAYTRVSREGKRERVLSHDFQHDRIIGLAGGLRLELWPQRISDTDRSGGSFAREGFNRALDLIRRGQAGGIAVVELDRFGRMDPLESIAMVREIEALGGQLVAGDLGGFVDLNDTMQLMTYFMRAAIGHDEWKRKRAGLTAARKFAVEHGRHLAKTYGYDRPEGYVLVDNPNGGRALQVRPPIVPNADAPAVREAFERRAEGMSWPKLAAYMNEHHPLPEGDWTWGRVRAMVRSPTYKGVAHSRGEHGTFEKLDAHEAIVSPALWERANRPKPGPSPDPTRVPRLLSGVLRCGSCGHRMTPKGDTNGRTHYRCKRRHKAGVCPRPVSIPAEAAEAYVLAQAEERFLALDVAGVAVQRSGERVREATAVQIAAATAYEEVVARMPSGASAAVTQAWDRRELTARMALDEATAELEHARSAHLEVDVTDDIDADSLHDLTLAQQRKLVHAIYPVVFARRGRAWREPVDQRLDLRRRKQAPDGLPGDRRTSKKREVPLREYFV